MQSFANRSSYSIMIGESGFSCNLCEFCNRGFLKQILSALICDFCMLEMTVCDWLNQQAFDYRYNGRIQDLYRKIKLLSSTFKLLKRQNWKILLITLFISSLQCSFILSCGVFIIPLNLMVLTLSSDAWSLLYMNWLDLDLYYSAKLSANLEISIGWSGTFETIIKENLGATTLPCGIAPVRENYFLLVFLIFKYTFFCERKKFIKLKIFFCFPNLIDLSINPILQMASKVFSISMLTSFAISGYWYGLFTCYVITMRFSVVHLISMYVLCCASKTLVASHWFKMRFSTKILRTLQCSW